MKSKFTIVAIGILVFLLLVAFNYFHAQREIRETRPAPLSIELRSFPETILVKNTGTFIWSVNSSPDLSTSFTTIYWGYESSPSALTKLDSPEAVRYPHFEQDYTTGSFRLPDTFDLGISFPKPGQIWFRAYTNLKGEHLWTDEHSLEVTK